MMLDEHIIASRIREVLSQYDVKEAYLFGSYARNEADEDSDIDICIECGESFTLFSLGGLGLALEKALGRPVDVICGSDSLYPRARQRYLKDRRRLYARSERNRMPNSLLITTRHELYRHYTKAPALSDGSPCRGFCTLDSNR